MLTPKSATGGAFWCGVHTATHNRIRAQQGEGGQISVYEKAAHIANVQGSRWGSLPETDAPTANVNTMTNADPTIVAACAFAVPFA